MAAEPWLGRSARSRSWSRMRPPSGHRRPWRRLHASRSGRGQAAAPIIVAVRAPAPVSHTRWNSTR